MFAKQVRLLSHSISMLIYVEEFHFKKGDMIYKNTPQEIVESFHREKGLAYLDLHHPHCHYSTTELRSPKKTIARHPNHLRRKLFEPTLKPPKVGYTFDSPQAFRVSEVA